MKFRSILIIIACIMLLSISFRAYSQEHDHAEGTQEESHDFSDSDLMAINKVIDQLERGYETNKLDEVMAAFADDAVLLEGRGINNGKKAIRDDHLAGEFKSMTFPVFKSKNRVIKGKGSIAYVYEILSIQMKRNSSETAAPAQDRRSLYILEKNSDGAWKIVLWRV